MRDLQGLAEGGILFPLTHILFPFPESPHYFSPFPASFGLSQLPAKLPLFAPLTSAFLPSLLRQILPRKTMAQLCSTKCIGPICTAGDGLQGLRGVPHFLLHLLSTLFLLFFILATPIFSRSPTFFPLSHPPSYFLHLYPAFLFNGAPVRLTSFSSRDGHKSQQIKIFHKPGWVIVCEPLVWGNLRSMICS